MTELIICTTCRTADTPRDQKAAGEILFEAVQAEQAFADHADWASVRVRGIACTAGCSRACTVALLAPGKHSYQFGDLVPSEATARQLLDCAALYHRTPDGKLARDARPPLLRNGLLCRLPPAGGQPHMRTVATSARANDLAFSAPEREAVYRAIFERRDMRHFAGGTVDPAVMRRLLMAAHHAPSVGYMQPWRFIRVASRALRADLKALVEQERERTAHALGERGNAFMRLKVEGLMDAAEVWVVALAEGRERHVFGRRTLPQMDLASVACAIQNMWLAARAEGLGMGWVSMFDPKAVAVRLGMPDGAEPVAMLCIGPVHCFYDEPMLEKERWSRRADIDTLLFEDVWGHAWGASSLPTPITDPIS